MKKLEAKTKICSELLLANAWFETNENNIFGNIWINTRSVLAQGVRKPLLYSLGTCCHWGTACIWCCMNVGLPAIILARPMAWWFFLVSKASTSTVKRSTSAAEIKIFGWIHSGDLPENHPVHNRHRNYHKAVSRDPVGLHLETWAWWMCSKDLNLPFENIANSYINKSWFTHGLQRLQGITQPNKEQVQRDMTEEAAQKRTERRVFFSMWTWWKSPMLGGCHLKMLCGFGAALVFNKNHVDKYF